METYVPVVLAEGTASMAKFFVAVLVPLIAGMTHLVNALGFL